MQPPQPPIELLGIRINEPVTTLTDLVLSAVCFYAFFKLSKYSRKLELHYYLRYYFLSMGVATLIGGIIGHGFIYLFPVNESIGVSPWKLPGWLTSMFSIALIERGIIVYAREYAHRRLGTIFSWLNIIELITFVTLTFATLNFFFVELHSTYGLMIVTALFSIISFYKTRSKGSRLFLYAVGVAMVSASLYKLKIGIHMWFNHLDISHILMSIAAYLFFLGSREMMQEERDTIK